MCQLWGRSLPYNTFHKFTVLLKLYPTALQIQQTWIMSASRHHVSSLFLALHFPVGCVGRDFQTRWSCLTTSLNSIRKRVVTLLMRHIHYTLNEGRNTKRQVMKNNQQAVVSLQRKNARGAPIFLVSQSKDHMWGRWAANKSPLWINGFAFLKGQNCSFVNSHNKLCNNSTRKDSMGYLG